MIISPQAPQPYRSLSLFSGAGGLDIGLHQVGFTPLACCELDRHARATISAWLEREEVNAPVFTDALQLNPQALLDQFRLQAGDLDLMFGGSPCQSYSLIGLRHGLEDARGQLLFEIPKLAAVMQPKVILMEQVKGLLSAPGYDGERGGALKELVLRLEAIGYHVRYKVINTADYGVPQRRQRVFIVAGERPFNFPPPTHAEDARLDDLFEHRLPYVTVRDVICDLPTPVSKHDPEEITNHRDITPDRDRERIEHVPEGQCLAHQLHLSTDLRCRLTAKDTTKFRRLHRDQPALTLRGGEPPYHPIEHRYITPREAMRISGFPDDHELIAPLRGRSGTVKDLDQHRLVANAVPPPIAAMLGKAIIEQLLPVPVLE